MSLRSCPLPLLLTSVLFASSAHAELHYGITDEWMSRPMTPATEPATLDQSLTTLSKASATNIFADATHLDGSQTITPYVEKRKAYQGIPTSFAAVLRNLTNQANLSYDRSNKTTLEIWDRPDALALVPLIVAREKAWHAQHPSPKLKETLPGLRDFFVANYGVKADVETIRDAEIRAKGVDEMIPLSKFPPNLQQAIETELHEGVTSR